MYNNFKFKRIEDQYLITNDGGHYAFLSPDDFKSLLLNEDSLSCEKVEELRNTRFLISDDKEIFINEVYPEVRHYKDYLFSSTSLHIFVVTTLCNQKCIYCQASVSTQDNSRMMNIETAKKAVDIALSANQEYFSFEFQGGEPLMNFPVIKFITEYTESIRGDKKVEYNIVSNLLLLNNEFLDFFAKHRFNISTSLDGGESLHNKNRPALKENSFHIIKRALESIRKRDLPISAIQTTTRHSLKQAKDIVDTYLELGFNSIFLRPLTKLGFAHNNWKNIGYTAEEFLDFYKEAIFYIIELGRKKVAIRESHASIFLKKILKKLSVNYMELRSPCGAAIGQLAYYYDGNVYTCDEGRMLGEMGDNSFCFGNVNKITYQDIINSPVCQSVCSASCLESIPYCSDCVYQPYCGICPVINFSENGSLFSQVPADFRCKVYMGIQDILFKIIKNGDESTIKLLYTWCC